MLNNPRLPPVNPLCGGLSSDAPDDPRPLVGEEDGEGQTHIAQAHHTYRDVFLLNAT